MSLLASQGWARVGTSLLHMIQAQSVHAAKQALPAASQAPLSQPMSPPLRMHPASAWAMHVHTSQSLHQQAREAKQAEGVWVVPMPKLSHSMSRGQLVKWYKKAGERVNMYDVLFEVVTDELTEDVFKVGDFAGDVHLLVEAQEEGWLAAIWHPAQPDKPVQVGTPVGLVVEDENLLKQMHDYQCPTSDVYDDKQPQVQILTWQSFLKSGKRQVKCMG